MDNSVVIGGGVEEGINGDGKMSEWMKKRKKKEFNKKFKQIFLKTNIQRKFFYDTFQVLPKVMWDP